MEWILTITIYSGLIQFTGTEIPLKQYTVQNFRSSESCRKAADALHDSIVEWLVRNPKPDKQSVKITIVCDRQTRV